MSDLVGLITFAGYADAITPPTLDHAFVMAQLNHQEIVSRRDEDGTAIGDAISLAVEKLNTLDNHNGQEKVKSKVLILLTDGENNAGDVDPVQAAELAKKMGVKIYTIGVGTRGSAPIPVRNPFTGQQEIQWMEVNIDEDALDEDRHDHRRQILPGDRHRVARRDLSRDRSTGKDDGRGPALRRLPRAGDPGVALRCLDLAAAGAGGAGAARGPSTAGQHGVPRICLGTTKNLARKLAGLVRT